MTTDADRSGYLISDGCPACGHPKESPTESALWIERVLARLGRRLPAARCAVQIGEMANGWDTDPWLCSCKHGFHGS